MREILFRGKEFLTGMWLEGSLIYGRREIIDNTLIVVYEEHGEELTFLMRDVYPETVGQYTGLTDKYGQKIFEGDIVKWRDSSSNSVCNIGEVYYDNRGYYYVRNTFYEYETDPLLESGQCEIIGNIHDNPELLKGGENNETPH